MKTNGTRLLLLIVIGLFVALGAAIAAPKKANHHDAKPMIGEKLKTNGTHVIDKKGSYTVSAEVKNSKVVGVHVKHAKKGDISVKKYKSTKKLAQIDGTEPPSLPAQEVIGTTYIGFAYIDEYGNEEIYWVPADIVEDPYTGAIEYVPVS
jgi:uncharacterized protein with FMN-binding domain